MKKELNEKIKLYSNKDYLNGYIKKEFLTNDGDADISIRLKEKYDLFDYRTVGDQLSINKEIFDYIDDKTSLLDYDININFHIIGLELSEKEEGRAKHIIKEHYAIELYKVQNQYRKEVKKSLILILFGVFLLFLYWIIYKNTNSEFLLEVFGFMFSFSLWIAFENFFYTVSEIAEERKNIAQKLLMLVEFK